MIVFTTTGRDLRALLAPVLPFVGQADLPVLATVHVTVTGDQLVAAATDRFRIGVIRRPLPTIEEPATDATQPGDFLLGARDVKRILDLFKPTRFENPTVKVTVDQDTCTVENVTGFDGIAAMSIAFDVTPPGEWPTKIYDLVAEACVPRDTDEKPIGLNAALLADFKAVVEHGEALVLHRGLHSKAIGVTCGDHFAGAIMPRRLVSSNADLWLTPAWRDLLADLARPAKKEAAA